MAEPATTEAPRTKEKVLELEQAAALQYSLKNFAAASDLYADAVEIQAEINGEMAPENAELLFYYGRALYKVAIAQSDVLGSKVAGEEKNKAKAKKAKKNAGEGSSSAANGTAKKEETVETKPYFQLTGDENWTDSEDEDEDGEAGQEEEADDFENAFQIFEIARVLYSNQLHAHESAGSADKGKGKAELTPHARSLKEKIADCHGFLVEIALENERFHDAVADAQSHLALQEELHPFEHENVTEAHYTLSLALEFASNRKPVPAEGADADAAAPPPAPAQPEGEEQDIDYEMREEAAKHTELAINSLTSRLKKENEALTSGSLTDDQKKEKQAIIKDKKDVLEDMKTRLVDLKTDPKNQAVDSIDPGVFQGILGEMLGADAATQKAKIEEVTKSAQDISGLVRTRKKEKAVPTASATAKDSGSGKRKLDVEEDATEGKRAKTEEIP